jgi:uncharacterized membrane protein SirB2
MHHRAMSMLAYYVPLKTAHVSLATGSGALFAVRCSAALAGQRWPLRMPWRLLSVAVDTLLLAAGVALWAMLSLNPLHDHWLATKLVLLVAYIALGSVALKRGRTPTVRWVCFGAALAVYLFIASVALAHDGLGAIAWIGAK